MARKVSPENAQEYEELTAFLGFWSTHVRKIDPVSPSHPTNVGRNILAAVGMSKALVGTRQAIHDVLEGLQDTKPESIRAIDEILRSNGLVTVTELRRRHSRQFRAISKRGMIRNDTEFYLVKAILDDVESPLTLEERERLGTMLVTFEQAAR